MNLLPPIFNWLHIEYQYIFNASLTSYVTDGDSTEASTFCRKSNANLGQIAIPAVYELVMIKAIIQYLKVNQQTQQAVISVILLNSGKILAIPGWAC